MDNAVRDTMRATGCSKGTVESLFSYFNEERCTTDVITEASSKFNMSPITVANALSIWKTMG